MDLHARLLVLVLGYHSVNQRDRDRLLRVEVIVRRGRDRFPGWQRCLRTVLMKKRGYNFQRIGVRADLSAKRGLISPRLSTASSWSARESQAREGSGISGCASGKILLGKMDENSVIGIGKMVLGRYTAEIQIFFAGLLHGEIFFYYQDVLFRYTGSKKRFHYDYNLSQHTLVVVRVANDTPLPLYLFFPLKRSIAEGFFL